MMELEYNLDLINRATSTLKLELRRTSAVIYKLRKEATISHMYVRGELFYRDLSYRHDKCKDGSCYHMNSRKPNHTMEERIECELEFGPWYLANPKEKKCAQLSLIPKIVLHT